MLVWTNDITKRQLIAFSFVSDTEIRLPTADDGVSSLNLLVNIRDTLGCITEYNLTSVHVLPDTAGINGLIDSLQVSVSAANGNPIVQILTSGNQNAVGQVLVSLSQVFNKMNNESIQTAVSSKYPSSS